MPAYKIYKDSISKTSSRKFFNFLLNVIKSYENDFCKKNVNLNWDDRNFNRELIKLRKLGVESQFIETPVLKDNASCILFNSFY